MNTERIKATIAALREQRAKRLEEARQQIQMLETLRDEMQATVADLNAGADPITGDAIIDVEFVKRDTGAGLFLRALGAQYAATLEIDTELGGRLIHGYRVPERIEAIEENFRTAVFQGTPVQLFTRGDAVMLERRTVVEGKDDIEPAALILERFVSAVNHYEHMR